MKLRVPPVVLSLALASSVAGFSAVTAAPATAATSAYTMTDLGNLGYPVSRGFAINAGGEVAGQSYTTKTVQFPCGRHICTARISHPFSWAGGTMTDLGTLGGIISQAFSVNSSGDIVGGSNGDAFLVHNGKMTDLGPGSASGINDFGEIAGSTSCCHAFVISGRTRTTLPDLSSYGGGISSATGINNSHQIVGGSDNASGYVHAVLWSNGTITDLGTLGGTQSAAYAINNLGQVTGWAHTASEATHVFLSSGSTMTDLGTFGLDPVGEAINNHGVIVGQSGNGAWIWSSGTFQNLNNLVPPGSGFTLDNATAINDNGQIVANGYNSVGQEHAFLLTPS
jgi:probable HAF family extracellular repeat protein